MPTRGVPRGVASRPRSSQWTLSGDGPNGRTPPSDTRCSRHGRLGTQQDTLLMLCAAAGWPPPRKSTRRTALRCRTRLGSSERVPTARHGVRGPGPRVLARVLALPVSGRTERFSPCLGRSAIADYPVLHGPDELGRTTQPMRSFTTDQKVGCSNHPGRARRKPSQTVEREKRPRSGEVASLFWCVSVSALGVLRPVPARRGYLCAIIGVRT